MSGSGVRPAVEVRATYEPAALVGQVKGRTRPPKFYFEVGKDDYPRALEASETMRALLADAGVAFEFAQHEGDHSWAYAAEGMTRLIAQFREGAASPWLRPLASLIGRDDLFPLAFRLDDARFGTCVGVHLPVAHSVDPASLLGSLHPEEQALCRSMRGPRLIEWIGGRHASRLARAGMPGAGSPTLSGLSGAPEVGGGVKISISHTERLAVALASPEQAYAIGVDVEAIPTDARGEELLAERILSPPSASERHRDGSAPLDQGSRLQGDLVLDGQASAVTRDLRGARRR